MSETIKLPELPVPDGAVGIVRRGGQTLAGHYYVQEKVRAYARLAVEQNTEALRAECDALRAELARLTTPNLYWIDGGESQVAEELCELADNIASDISGDDRECTVTVGCARELPSMQMRVWIDDKGNMDYDTTPLPDVKEVKE